MWEKSFKVNQPTVRDDGLFGPDVDFQSCAPDEIVIGGGGSCFEPDRAWIHDSVPDTVNNGWWVNCFGRNMTVWATAQDSRAKAFAICLKKQ